MKFVTIATPSSTYPWDSWLDLYSFKTVGLYILSCYCAKFYSKFCSATSEIEDLTLIFRAFLLNYWIKVIKSYIQSGLQDRRKYGKVHFQTKQWKVERNEDMD